MDCAGVEHAGIDAEILMIPCLQYTQRICITQACFRVGCGGQTALNPFADFKLNFANFNNAANPIKFFPRGQTIQPNIVRQRSVDRSRPSFCETARCDDRLPMLTEG